MMRYLVLVRHGETETNRINKGPEEHYVIGGRSLSVPLLPEGEASAIEAGREIAGMVALAITHVISSDAERAIRTRELIVAELPEAENRIVRATKNFRERYAGEFDGRRKQDVMQEYPEYFSDPALMNWQHNFSVKAPGGENYSDVLERVQREMEPLLEKESGDILVVSHVIPIRCLLCWLLGLTQEQTLALKIPNATPIVLELGENNRLVGDVTLETLLS